MELAEIRNDNTEFPLLANDSDDIVEDPSGLDADEGDIEDADEDETDEDDEVEDDEEVEDEEEDEDTDEEVGEEPEAA